MEPLRSGRPTANIVLSARSGLPLSFMMARWEAEAPPPPHVSRHAIEEGCYQANRYRLKASLLGDSGRPASARVLARQMIRQVLPCVRELGCDAALDGAERILREGTGAELQRRVYAEQGMGGLLRWLMQHRRQLATPSARN